MRTTQINQQTGQAGIEHGVSTVAQARLRQRLTTGMTCLAATLSLFGAMACQNMNPPPPIPAEAAASRPSTALAPGDALILIFPGAPELNTKQKIQANGKVSLPTLGDVSASGRTITGFQSQLTSMYQPHLQDPTVVVSLESAAAGVYVSGEVLRPGKIPLDRPMTALEVVMEAGGFSRFANPKQVIVVRNEKGKHRRYVLNLNDTLSGMESTPFYVRPFDVIYVRKSAW